MLKIEGNKQELVQDLLTSFKQFPKMLNKRNNTGQKRSEIMVLLCIGKSGEGEMKVSEISRRLHVKAPTVTQLVNELESKGQIERITRPSDRRFVWIRVTEAGEKVIRKAEQEIQNTYNGLIEYLGEEETRQLITSLNKVHDYFIERFDKAEQEKADED